MTDTFHSMNTKPYGASKRNVLCFFYEPDSSQSDPDPTTGHPGSSDIQIHNWPGIYNVQFKPKLIQKQSQVIEASMLGDKDKFRGTLARDMALDPKCNVTADVLNKLAEDDPAYMAWSDNTPTPGARGYVFPTGNQMVVPLIRIEEALVALHPHVKRINFYSHLCLGRWDGEKVVGNTDSLDNDINYNISEALGAVSTDERRVFPTFTTSADKTQQDKIHIRQEELSRFQADKDKQGSMIPDTIAEIDGSGEDDDDDDDDDDVDDVDDVGHGFR